MDVRPDQIKALIFDKDGTLFDFRATWDAWAGALLRDLSDGDDVLLQRLADAVSYDLAQGALRPDSVAIAGTNTEIAEALEAVLRTRDPEAVLARIKAGAATAPLAPAADLHAVLGQLKSAGLKLGVMTNDSHAIALAHLDAAGVTDLFDVILGADSGYGAKPSAEPLLAFCAQVGVDPHHTAMVGDSTHDLLAAEAAGMTGLGVLTGVATSTDLERFAERVLDTIADIPKWLGVRP